MISARECGIELSDIMISQKIIMSSDGLTSFLYKKMEFDNSFADFIEWVKLSDLNPNNSVI